jgi:hypothetical protein
MKQPVAGMYSVYMAERMCIADLEVEVIAAMIFVGRGMEPGMSVWGMQDMNQAVHMACAEAGKMPGPAMDSD